MIGAVIRSLFGRREDFRGGRTSTKKQAFKVKGKTQYVPIFSCFIILEKNKTRRRNDKERRR
ncbi:hypothetical protein LINGRAPRIM_LOCUS2494 [Linum grandiflorum]